MLPVRKKKRRRKTVAAKRVVRSQISPRARAILERTRLARAELDRALA